MKKYDKQDQLSLAVWAADCAQRVLPFFENVYAENERPRKAIETCRAWVNMGTLKMAVIREASLGSHAAARETKENSAARFAARAAGQAVATAHVPQHAFGAAYYALKAVAAADPAKAECNVVGEYDWQLRHIHGDLRGEVMRRVMIEKGHKGPEIRIDKDKDF